MTPEQKEILVHALGLDMVPRGMPCRNYFNVELSGKTFDACAELESMGLMRRGKTIPGPSIYFYATAEGVQRAVGLMVPIAEIEEWMKTSVWPSRRKRRRSYP